MLDNGVIDKETITVILEECDVKGTSMNLNEWMAVVEVSECVCVCVCEKREREREERGEVRKSKCATDDI